MLLLGACRSDPASQEPPAYKVPIVGLKLPRLAGWKADELVQLEDPAKGGTALRLVREAAVAGSPRIEVVLEPLQVTPTQTVDFLTRNLREMGDLEAKKQIHIVAVEQKPVQVGPLSAYRVRHEYTMGSGGSQVAIMQLSLFVVSEGRGVAITAAGRTELFHPLAESINRIFDGITTIAAPPSEQAQQPTANPSDAAGKTGEPSLLEPIDLGRIGGGSR